MSFDPNLPDDGDERPRRREQRLSRYDDHDRPRRSAYDDDDAPRRRSSPRDEARSYATPPAIIMIVCALMNVPAVLFCAWTLIFHLSMNVDDFVANQRKVKQDIGLNNDQLLQNPAASLTQIQITYGIMTTVFGLATLLILLGGIQMMRLRGYALSLIGAFALTIPCITSCCVVGQGVGIWALIVLFTTSVREEFQ